MELYLSGVKPYMELEIQSAAQKLKAGESLDWRIHWMLVELPENLEVEVGSASLLDFVRREVERTGGNIALIN
ncbi:hypothetical protein [Microbulbifer epialgicus]|uniref:Uncharacterized protein n=1 Tax=Microbulbifer epialgicus TaxID=393907 RepID=A0ABV4NXB9_9GAMM